VSDCSQSRAVSKRLTNTTVRQARSVLKCPDSRKNRVVSVQATYPCGSSAVGGRVCEQRYAAERVLPESRVELQQGGRGMRIHGSGRAVEKYTSYRSGGLRSEPLDGSERTAAGRVQYRAVAASFLNIRYKRIFCKRPNFSVVVQTAPLPNFLETLRENASRR
jgi:hypothetical protein